VAAPAAAATLTAPGANVSPLPVVSSYHAESSAGSYLPLVQDSINYSMPRLAHGALRLRRTGEARLAARDFAQGLHGFAWAQHQERSLREQLQAVFVPDPRLPSDMEALVLSLAARLAERYPDPAPVKAKRHA